MTCFSSIVCSEVNLIFGCIILKIYIGDNEGYEVLIKLVSGCNGYGIGGHFAHFDKLLKSTQNIACLGMLDGGLIYWYHSI